MLNKVNFPLTNAQLSGFFQEKGYTSYIGFQQVLAELEEAKLISYENVRNIYYYKITKDGKETIDFFVTKIPVEVIDDIDLFLVDNKYEMRNEVATMADYYHSADQDIIVSCKIKEGNAVLMEMNLSVPTEEVAEIMCNNWRNVSQDVYSTVMKTLMKEKKKAENK
jgi:hypothetical protein